MYAYGLTIAVLMHRLNVVPRIRWEAAVAQSLFRRTPRFGPTVPVVPAAASVWHEPQPPGPVNTCLPEAGVTGTLACTAVASAPVSWPGSDATEPTYAATSWASCPE